MFCCLLAVSGCTSTVDRVHNSLRYEARASLDFVADTVSRANRSDHHGIAAQILYRPSIQLRNPRWEADVLLVSAVFDEFTERPEREVASLNAARPCAEIAVDKEAALRPAPCPAHDFSAERKRPPVEYTLPEIHSKLNVPDHR